MTAWNGEEPARSNARSLILDPNRLLISCLCVRLELIPKATFNNNNAEVTFYEGLFSTVAEWIPVDDDLIRRAIEIGCIHDVANIDSIHIAAAIAGNADQFVTIEKQTKPMYRVSAANPIHLRDAISAG